MPKIHLKFQLGKRIFCALFLLFFCNSIHCQTKINIAYGSKINLGRVPEDARFEVRGPKSIRLKGSKINQFEFEKPGVYTISVEEKKHKEHDCREYLPKEISVEVSRIRMDFKQPLAFSSPIVKNSDTQGITLSVPVQIETYDHLPALLNKSTVQTAGIGANITAELKTQTEQLPEGMHQLEYALSGKVTENSYLMFDFIDANGQVQSVPVLTPVKN